MLKNAPFAITVRITLTAVLLAGATAWAAGEPPDLTLTPRMQVAQSAVPPPSSPGNVTQTGAETMPVFEPPPVPAFMLRKPAQPLTLQEMDRQAEEAAAKARRAREAANGGAVSRGVEK